MSLEDWMTDQVSDPCIAQQSSGIPSRVSIECSHTDGLIPFLELVGSAQKLPVQRLVELALRTFNVGKDILVGGGKIVCWDCHSLRFGAASQDPE